MKLERLPEYTTIVVTIACGMLLSLYVGVSAGSGSNTPWLLIGGFVAATIALVLRANIWLLIPLCAPLTGKLPGMPGALGLCHLAIIYSFVVYLGLKALKVVRYKPRYDWLDYLLLINLAYLLTVYIRNPVGTLGMGFEKIGGKPYIEIIVAILAYWVLTHVTISPKLAMRMPFLMILGNIVTTIGIVIGKIFPSVGVVLGYLYSGFRIAPTGEDDAPSSDAPSGDSTSDTTIDREGYWLGAGTGIINVFCSYFSPLSLFNPLHFFRFLLTAVVCVGILKSGFRSALIYSSLFFFAAAYFREGLASALRVPVLCIPFLCLVLFGQGTVYNLPLNVQRSLSFLPGKWDPSVLENAQGSTDWRIEIWKNVWNSGNKYIQNRWFGDGFGMTRSQLREALQPGADGQENLTVAGDYHSLPLSTIHVVGYVGLVLLLIQMVGLTYYAWALIRRAAGTPYFPLALYVGVPAVYGLFTGFLIFGAYNLSAPGNIYTVAWLRLLSRSLDVYLGEFKKTPVESTPPFPELAFPRASRPSMY